MAVTLAQLPEAVLQAVESFGPSVRSGAGPPGAQAIAWWESRRVLYNGVLIAGGLASFALLLALLMLGPVIGVDGGEQDLDCLILSFVIPMGLLAFFVLANVFYTGGWVVELLLRGVLKARGGRFAAKAWVAGAVFSAMLTMAPALWVMLETAVNVVYRPSEADLVGTYRGGYGGDWLELRPGAACVQGWVTGPGEASLHDCTWRQDGRHVELHGVDFGRHDAPWRSGDKTLFIRRTPTGYIILSCCMDIPFLSKADAP